MAAIITITPPAPYSSVKEPVIFGIDRPATSPCEVEVNGHVKLLSNDARRVNVAHYFKEKFDIQPNVSQGKTLALFDGVDSHRVVNAQIVVDGAESASVPLTCADRRPSPNRFMSNLRDRVIAVGDMDEIPIYTTTPAVIVCGGSEPKPLGIGVSYVGLRTPSGAPQFSAVLMSPDGKELDRIKYEVGSKEGVRLAWINAYGAIDFWTFENRRKSTIDITKEKIYSQHGYISTLIQAETTHTVYSQVLPESTIAALNQLFVSERVWIVEGDSVRIIDVTNESATIYDADKMGFVQVDYRNNTRQL